MYKRQHWILEHWPHIVEYAEIANTLINQLWGPDTAVILNNLAPEPGSALAAAVAADESWLPIAVGGLAPQWATTLGPKAASALHDLADHRQRWSITTAQPLGPTATHPEQGAERVHLTEQLTIRTPHSLLANVDDRTAFTVELQ